MLPGFRIGRDIQSNWRRNSLALTGGLEALEFMEGPVHASFNVSVSLYSLPLQYAY